MHFKIKNLVSHLALRQGRDLKWAVTGRPPPPPQREKIRFAESRGENPKGG